MYLDNDGIEEFITELDRDTKAIKQELLKLCWYMRGGLSYTEAHCLILEERELISKIVDENLETTKESGLPFF